MLDWIWLSLGFGIREVNIQSQVDVVEDQADVIGQSAITESQVCVFEIQVGVVPGIICVMGSGS
jgi:hypothetical protein